MRQLLIKEIKEFIKIKGAEHLDSNDLESLKTDVLNNIYEQLIQEYGQITEEEKSNLSFNRQ
jgi:hypothetical protein